MASPVNSKPGSVDEEVARLIAELGAAFAASGDGIRQAAYLAEVSPGTIRNLLAGQRTPRLDVFSRVSVALGLRVELDMPGGGPRRTDGSAASRAPLCPYPHFKPPTDIELESIVHDWAAGAHVLIASELLWILENELRWTGPEAARAWGIDFWTLRRLLRRETSPRLDTLVRISAGAGRCVVLTDSASPYRVMAWDESLTTGQPAV